MPGVPEYKHDTRVTRKESRVIEYAVVDDSLSPRPREERELDAGSLN